jgi:outer membrane protein assembly factor BamB
MRKYPRLALHVLAAPSFAVAVTLALACEPGLVLAQWPSAPHGHILISDQYNNRVIEVDVRTHQVVWTFGDGMDTPGPHSVVGVNDAERVGPFTLISGTGIPPSTPPVLPGCSTPDTGCADNRVFFVDEFGHIFWQYGQAGVTGSGPNQLNTPVQALFTSSFMGHFGFYVLIADQGNQRIIVVDWKGNIVWQYGTTGVSGSGPNQLNSPNSGEILENGNILIADESNNRVIEIKPSDGSLVMTFTASNSLGAAAFASRLPNGDTLISDAGNNRIVEVDKSDNVVWQYVTNTGADSNPNPQPTRGIRLHNGNTLISDQYNNRVIEVTHAGKIVFQQGKTNVLGNGFNRLNGPYDAKQIGDFTGLTPPFDFDHDGDD